MNSTLNLVCDDINLSCPIKPCFDMIDFFFCFCFLTIFYFLAIASYLGKKVVFLFNG